VGNQAAGAARVYPVGRAVLLLAVSAPELAGRRIAVDGRRVQALRVGRLALLLSFVDQAGYAPEEIERKRCDPAWLATEARVLEQAVERVRPAGPIVPLPLLTAFPHATDLEALARERYAKWSRALTRLGTKRECVVHLYAGPHAPPGGEPYVLRVTQRATRTTRVPAFDAPAPTLEHAQRVWQACAEVGSATRRVRTAGRRGALWSGAFLLSEDGIEKLAGVLSGFSAAGAALGVTAHLEAPRAPFTFV
jgi:hypothetical protein